MHLAIELITPQQGQFSKSCIAAWEGDLWLWGKDSRPTVSAILVSTSAAPSTRGSDGAGNASRALEFMWIDQSKLPSLLVWVFLRQGRHAAQRGAGAQPIDAQLAAALRLAAEARLNVFDNDAALRRHTWPDGVEAPPLRVVDVFGYNTFSGPYGANAFRVQRADGSLLQCESCAERSPHCHTKEILAALPALYNAEPWHI
jgi:hypothetical protein